MFYGALGCKDKTICPNISEIQIIYACMYGLVATSLVYYRN